jgi:hypothetical protein
MHSQSLRYFIFLGITISLVNCQTNSHDPDFLARNGQTNISKEIPVYKQGPSKGKIDYAFTALCEETSALGLKSLTNGFDSLQIRIWLGHSLAINNEVVILKYRNRKWSGKLISYSMIFTDSGEQYSLIRRQRNLYPNSGWETLINNLYKLQLLTLQNGEDLIGYDGCGADGIRYLFEWATTLKYRMYLYCNPKENSVNFWQAKNVIKIAELLEQEFNFSYIK